MKLWGCTVTFMERMGEALSGLPDYFNKEDIKEWIEKWKEIFACSVDYR